MSRYLRVYEGSGLDKFRLEQYVSSSSESRTYLGVEVSSNHTVDPLTEEIIHVDTSGVTVTVPLASSSFS
jgi:hypothetical protein